MSIDPSHTLSPNAVHNASDLWSGVGASMVDLFRYAAFISYSSKDAGFANRLHKALETYRIPTTLGRFDIVGGGKKNRVFPVFRDREELPAGSLGDELQAALRASNALIVVCSPNSAGSHWVGKEIEYFRTLRPGRVFAIIADTAPLVVNGVDGTAASFPPAFAGLELIAADARKGKDGFRNAWLKLVAGLIGVNAGALQNRDRRRRTLRRMQAAAAGTAIVFSALYTLAWIDAQSWRSALVAQAREFMQQGRTLDALSLSVAGGEPLASMLPFAGRSAGAALGERNGFHLVADLGGADGYNPYARSPTDNHILMWGPKANYVIVEIETGRQLSLGVLASNYDAPFSDTGNLFVGVSSKGLSFGPNAAADRKGLLVDLDAWTVRDLGHVTRAPVLAPGGRWVFVHNPDGEGELVDARGGPTRSLGQVANTPEFSADGKRMAIRMQGDDPDMGSGVVLVDLETDAREAFVGEFFAMKFSPDGAHLFLQKEDSGSILLSLQSDSRRVFDFPIRDHRFSSDSVGFIALTQGSGQSFAEYVNLTDKTAARYEYDGSGPRFLGSGIRMLLQNPAGEFAVVTPGEEASLVLGTYLSIDELPDGVHGHTISVGGDHVLLDLTSGRRTELGDGAALLPWTYNDEEKFVLLTNSDGVYSKMTLATEETRQLDSYFGEPAISRDGDWIAGRANGSPLTLYNFDTGKSLRIPDATGDGPRAGVGDYVLGVFSFNSDWFVADRDDGSSFALHLESGQRVELGILRVTPEFLGERNRLLLQSGNGNHFVVDLITEPASRGPEATSSTHCTWDSGATEIRPLTHDLRLNTITSSSAGASSRLPRAIASIVAGRPWNPCDWRGLGAVLPDKLRGDAWFEGPRQWWRRVEVTILGKVERDYLCGETTAAGAISARRIESCRKAGTSPDKIAVLASD